MPGISLPLLDTAGSALAWQVHPEVLLWLALIQGAYLYTFSRLRPADQSDAGDASNQVLLFSLGIIAFYLAAGTPLHDLGEHYLFSAHMLEHLILTLIAPPLLLLGLPGWMLRPLLRCRGVQSFGYVVTRPIIAFAFFNMVVLFTHLPGSMDLVLHHHSLHFCSHVLLALSAMLMWWPVLSPLPEMPRSSYPVQMLYLFVHSFLPAVLSAFIIFTSAVVYPFYEAAPKIWGLSAVDDQRIGGLVMKLGGTAILWTFMTVIFFLWFRQEERDEPAIPPPPTPLVWHDVEAELARMGLTDREART